MTTGLDDRQRALLQEVLARHGLSTATPEPDDLDRLSAVEMRSADEGRDLTARQIQVLALIADGYSNSGIARELHLSVETVKAHIRRIHAGLPAKCRAHAVAQGFRKGLIE